MKDLLLTGLDKQKEYFGNVLVIGLGMIGGSFAKALKSRELAYIYGADRRSDELELGLATHVIDEAVKLTKENVQKMDIILLATPVRAMPSILTELKPLLASHTLVTDVGSTKGSVVDAAKFVFGSIPANFIPGHPIAGAERSGVLAANANLFEEHKVILTPLPNVNPVLLNNLHRIWSAIGGEVLNMEVEHHDSVLANTSHLPHLLAYTLVDALANDEKSQDVFRFAAGGFRDFTRIASSDPVMWRDVFLANKDAALASLDHFSEHLQRMRNFIENEDGPSMFGIFSRAKSARDHFLRLQNNQVTSVIKPISIEVSSASLIKGELSLTGDRVLSQQALLLSALSKGISDLKNVNQSASTKVTVQALRDMGVVIEDLQKNSLRVHGVGLHGLKAPIAAINIQQSVLSLYALLPVLVMQRFSVTLTADDDLLTKPFVELLSLVKSLGGCVLTSEGGCLPFNVDAVVSSENHCKEKIYQCSDNMKTAVLMASIVSPVNAVFSFPKDSYIGDIEYFLKIFDSTVIVDSNVVSVESGEELEATDIVLPSDAIISSWLILAAGLSPGSNLKLSRVPLSIKEKHFLSVLVESEANIKLLSEGGRESYTYSVKVGFEQLKPFLIVESELPKVGNDLLFLCVAAVYASGKSRIEGVDSLSYDWQDRLFSFVDALQALQIPCAIQSGVLEIDGCIPNGAELDCAGDYLLALAMLALGIRSRHPIVVHDCQHVFEEFEGFEVLIKQVGFNFQLTSQ